MWIQISIADAHVQLAVARQHSLPNWQTLPLIIQKSQSLVDRLFVDLEDARFPARSDAFDLLDVKIMTATDPLQAGL